MVDAFQPMEIHLSNFVAWQGSHQLTCQPCGVGNCQHSLRHAPIQAAFSALQCRQNSRRGHWRIWHRLSRKPDRHSKPFADLGWSAAACFCSHPCLNQRAALAGQQTLGQLAILRSHLGLAQFGHRTHEPAQALPGRWAARMARSTSCAHCGIGVPGPKMPAAPSLYSCA